MLVGAVEPVAQVGCRFIGCLTVKGHHGGWYARNPHNVGAPAFFGHPCHFNDKGTARNNSFNAMLHDGSTDKLVGDAGGGSRDSTRNEARNKRNEVQRRQVVPQFS